MQPASPHGSWSSRTTFLLAAVGAAVGLGNIWKFPYLTGVSGGGAFVAVYVLCAIVVAVPILIGELLVGRRGHRSPAVAMEQVASESGRSGAWWLVGALGIVVAYLILSYYSVIAGWALSYVFSSVSGTFAGASGETVAAHFSSLLADPLALIFWHTVFMSLTVAVVAPGLQRGIERAVTILMPALFVMLLFLIAYAAVTVDMAGAIDFLFSPDFSKVDAQVVLAAVGQAFFSIGVAMGIMMTYGAYLPREVSIPRAALIIAAADTTVAILAGLAIFPLVFANGLDPGEGPGLIFVTLPIAFGSMPGGSLFGFVFFVLLTFAALTSAIAVLEPMVSWVRDRFGVARVQTTIAAGIVAWLIGLSTVFSFNLWADVRLLPMIEGFADKSLFDLLDHLTSNIMIPVGGIFIAVFVGWRMKRSALLDELGVTDTWLFRAWRFLIAVVCPVAILLILLGSIV